MRTSPKGQLFDFAQDIDMHYPGFNLECYPNRDSTIYSSLYGIEDAHTVFRGTLRYRGFSELMGGLSRLGLLNEADDARLVAAPTPTWVCMNSPEKQKKGKNEPD